jgi:exonuclease V gamma subunit
MVGFRPVADAGAHLAELLHLYRLGQRCPLPLFARASRRYAERLRHGDDPAVALAAAHDTFSDQSFGEGNDEYVLQAFTEQDPLAAELSVCVDDASDRALRFTELAETVFVPLLEHREPA